MDDTKSKWALIVAGGKPIKHAVLAHLDEPDLVIAADSGLDQAFHLGLRPDLVVGDMDSVTSDSLQRAIDSGISVERHPVAKNATDLELAIAAAERAGYTHGTIIGGTGGRMAHTLANALLLLEERSIRLDWKTSRATIVPLRSGESHTYHRDDGVLLSVLAVGGNAACRSQGLFWPLDGIALAPGSTHGISNELAEQTAHVTVVSGQVLTVHERN